MKHLLLKTWLMLVCLMVGVGTTWAETYTKITSLSELTTGDYVIVGCQTSSSFGKLTYELKSHSLQ